MAQNPITNYQTAIYRDLRYFNMIMLGGSTNARVWSSLSVEEARKLDVWESWQYYLMPSLQEEFDTDPMRQQIRKLP